jgi:hypothetical protein
MKKQTRRKVWPLVSPIDHAMASASVMPAAERGKLIARSDAAAGALQFGTFTAQHWRDLADAFNIAEALARPPVNIANDHADKFDAAQKELFALSEQFRDRGTWTPRGTQLQVIKDALFIHEIQMNNVGQGELERAVQRLINRVMQARQGNGNCTLVEGSV